MMLPIAIVLWIIGWTLFFIGSKQQQKTQKLQLLIQQEPTFLVSVPEPQKVAAQQE
jgi:hypothetical protein